jgi:hypothetical protein
VNRGVREPRFHCNVVSSEQFCVAGLTVSTACFFFHDEMFLSVVSLLMENHGLYFNLYYDRYNIVFAINRQMHCSDNLLVYPTVPTCFDICTSSSGNLLLCVLMSYIKITYSYVIYAKSPYIQRL